MELIKNLRLTNMEKKLFIYMMFMAVLLLSALLTGLFIMGRFRDQKEELRDTFELQMKVFEREIFNSFDNLNSMGIQLSENISHNIEDFLDENHITFGDLKDDPKLIDALERRLFTLLKGKLLQVVCSGDFVLLNTTADSSSPKSQVTRSGVYLQRISPLPSENAIRLFRGGPISAIDGGNLALHKNWRKEFRTDFFPSYDELMRNFTQSPKYVSQVTDVCIPPGTNERSFHLAVPVMSPSGDVYGFCGFEMNQSLFQLYYAQPSNFDHLTCMVVKKKGGRIVAQAGLNAGTSDGYHKPPYGALEISHTEAGLSFFDEISSSYVGIAKDIRLVSDEPDFSLVIMIPKEDYLAMVDKRTLHFIVLMVLISLSTTASCLYFSKIFLSPILKAFESIHRQEMDPSQCYGPEIDDLIIFLSNKDKDYENKLAVLEDKKAAAQESYAQAQSEIDRLAYARHKEMDPADFERFCEGLSTLTKAEKRVFDLYLSDLTAKEIMEILSIKESTLKYHNHNILGKLGVSSRKQMLRFAALLSHEQRKTE